MLGWLYFIICALALFVTHRRGDGTLSQLAALITMANVISFGGSHLLKRAKGRLMAVRDTFITLHFGSSLAALIVLTYALVAPH